MTPRIAIPVPTTIDLPYNRRSWPTYAAAVSRSGGEPIAVDITLPPAEILALATTCHAILLPGSPADVDPALYGAERLPECGPADPAREAADRILLDHAAGNAEAGRPPKPVLAICYGLQFLNVWRGGSLLQDLSPLPVNHSAGATVAIAHTGLIAPQSLLATLADPSEAPMSGDFLRLPMNTSHHQSVAAPGSGLRIVARCPDDGVIEALELNPDYGENPSAPLFHVEQLNPGTPSEASSTPQDPQLFHVEQFAPGQSSQPVLQVPSGFDESPKMFHVEQSTPPNDQTPAIDCKLFHVEQSTPGTQIVPRGTIRPQFLLGVQWHPERSYDISPTSRALFHRLIAEARLYADPL